MISLIFALLLAQEKIIVEGVVVNALTDEPLKKAQVTLMDANRRYAVVSGSEGKFRFVGIEPGLYDAEAQRQGFVPNDDEEPLNLSPGERVKDIVIKLTPQGIIAGHVLDEDGDPVPGLEVVAARTIHVNGRAVVLGRQGSMMTDNEGYFLVSELEAGRYYLSAAPISHLRQDAQPGHPGTEEDFIRIDDGVPRDITPGAALRGIELHVHRSAVYRIRGRVSNPRNDGARIELRPPDGSVTANRPQAALKDGAFEFAGIAPGSYVLAFPTYATLDQLAANPNRFCHVPITVVDHDIEGLTIELTPGPSIEGTIRMESEAFPKPPIFQLSGGGITRSGAAKADGTFGWTNLSPLKYIFDYGPPDGYYMKSIELNQQPLKSPLIDLTDGIGGTLDVLIAPHAASVSIAVEGGKPAQIALWNDSKFETWDTGPDGAASMEHLPPGEYRILAFQKIEQSFVEIPEFRARFDAQNITLAVGAHETIEVKLIPKSATDAEIAKLQ
jgi:hypothetical protein